MNKIIDRSFSLAFVLLASVSVTAFAVAATLPLTFPMQAPVPVSMPPRAISIQEVRVVAVVDADTLVVEPIATQFRVRLSNADAWESRKVRRSTGGAVTDAEVVKGKKASAAVEVLIRGARIYVKTEPHGKEPVKRDNFGRVLGEVKIHSADTRTVDLGEWLDKHGHTRN